MNIMSIIGARPQFIKAACLSQVLRQKHQEFLVHTGQHYDENMSDVFFHELKIPSPDINLRIGSNSHPSQTAMMMMELEKLMSKQKPDIVIVYGDTTSTLAGALTAVQLRIPVAHVEAGLRSYNQTMPEEVNRVITDHISRWLFCPTTVAQKNLQAENITAGVSVTGDIMVDAIMANIAHVRADFSVEEKFGVKASAYGLMTIHRPANADVPEHMSEIFNAIGRLNMPVIFPVHPRTRKTINQFNLAIPKQLRLIEPVSYFEMLALLEQAKVVITDSGGLQKEAYVLKTPCVTVRPETEWLETIEEGWNRLASPELDNLGAQIQDAINESPKIHSNVYGDGKAAQRMVSALETSY